MAGNEWRKISDGLPKDGRYVYMSSSVMGIPVLARYVEEKKDFICYPAYAAHGKVDGKMDVSHWMPLPTPPEG